MKSERGVDATVIVLLLAAAVSGSTTFVPGMWRLVTAVCGIALCGVAFVLAIRRYQRRAAEGGGRERFRMRVEPTVVVAFIIVAVGTWIPLLPDIWTVVVAGFVVPVLCIVGLVLAIRRYQRQVAISPRES